MDMNSLVTVIVPIYMVQNYLERCVESIRNQTYKNLEIILVDDGSKDDCGKIADRIAMEDKRISVIHKENGGLSDARNAGIDIANGEYLVFIDSDDYIHPQMIELLIKPVLEKKADMSVCSYLSIEEDEKIEFREIENADISILREHSDKTKIFFEGDSYVCFTVAWNKLYPRDYFEKIRYPKGKIHEDEFTTYKLLDKAERVAYIKTPLYYYLNRKNSIMGGGFNEKSLHKLEAMNERIRYYLVDKNYEWAEKMLFFYKLWYVRFAGNIIKNKKNDYSILEPYFKNYRELTIKNVFKFPCSFKKKLGYLSMAFFQNNYIKTHIN